MQHQLLNQPSIKIQLAVAGGLGLLLGMISVWLPPYFALVGIAGMIYLVVAWLWPEIALLVILFFTSTIIDLSNVSAIPSIPIGIGHLIISDILVFALFGIILLRVLVNSSLLFNPYAPGFASPRFLWHGNTGYCYWYH